MNAHTGNAGIKVWRIQNLPGAMCHSGDALALCAVLVRRAHLLGGAAGGIEPQHIARGDLG